MKYTIATLASLVFATTTANAEINFSEHFYTDEIKTCEAMPVETFSEDTPWIERRVQRLVGFDWPTHHWAKSTAANIQHKEITRPMITLQVASHWAVSENDPQQIATAVELLTQLAETETLYDSIGYVDTWDKPLCWANGPDIPCHYHEYEFAAGWFSNYMITAIWLREHLDEDSFTVVDNYIEKMYGKFIRPIEFRESNDGFYQMANGGTSVLIYANWKDDVELAEQEIAFRFQDMTNIIFDDGYIDNNSFREERSQWYHTYGLNIMLGYVYIAQEWGAEVPDELMEKLTAASHVTNLAINDHEAFRSRPYGDEVRNAVLDTRMKKQHTHQMAFAIDVLMEHITGVEMDFDELWVQRRGFHEKTGHDDLIGFNPLCSLL